MNCKQTENWLSAYVDGDLDPIDAGRIEAHAAACGRCRDALDEMRALARAVAGLPRLRPSDAADLAIRRHCARPPDAQPPASAAPAPAVMDAGEAAAYLRIDETTLAGYLDALPHFELGGKVLFRRSSIEAWIEECEQAARWRELPHGLMSGTDNESEVHP